MNKRRWTEEALLELLNRWRSLGATPTALAAEHGVSRSRIYQLLRSAERREIRAQSRAEREAREAQ